MHCVALEIAKTNSSETSQREGRWRLREVTRHQSSRLNLDWIFGEARGREHTEILVCRLAGVEALGHLTLRRAWPPRCDVLSCLRLRRAGVSTLERERGDTVTGF